MDQLQNLNLIPDTAKVWIFQTEPDTFKMENQLLDEFNGSIPSIVTWGVKQHIKKILKGHIGLIWIARRNRGIYGVTEIVTDPDWVLEEEYESNYWVNHSNRGKKEYGVKMQLLVNMVNKPLYGYHSTCPNRKTINDTPSLQAFMRKGYGTNIQQTNIEVKPEEWPLLKNLIRAKLPNYEDNLPGSTSSFPN